MADSIPECARRAATKPTEDSCAASALDSRPFFGEMQGRHLEKGTAPRFGG